MKTVVQKFVRSKLDNIILLRFILMILFSFSKYTNRYDVR
jgi:hypothetical protein